MKRTIIAAFFGTLALPTSALADDPCSSISNLISRPTVTNSGCTVAPNHTLMETGYQNISSSTAGNTVTYPQMLIRVGTEAPKFEVEFAPPNITRMNGMHGVGDIGGGIKYLFSDTARAQVSGQVNLTAATGDAFASAGASQTMALLNGAYSVSPVFTLASTQISATNAANGVRYGSYGSTLALSASLPHASSLFAEYALTTHAVGPATGSRTQFMYGLTHDVGQHLQLDIEGVSSPTKSTGAYTGMGFGASFLL